MIKIYYDKSRRLKRRTKRKLKLRFGISNPTLIYQMGKIGSASIYWSLESNDNIDLFHVHRINPANIEAVRKNHIKRNYPVQDDRLGLMIYEKIIKPNKPAKIISLVREPIGRNISAHFQNLDAFYRVEDAHDRIPFEKIIKDFINHYNHDTPLKWFDNEIYPTTNIDVFNHPFPNKKGYQIISQPPYELLVMKHDLDDKIKEHILTNFLSLDHFVLKRKNVGAEKSYADQYRKFVNTVKLPESYISLMLNSKYAKHFYSQDELNDLKKFWKKS